MSNSDRTRYASTATVFLSLAAIAAPLHATDLVRTVALTGSPVSAADPSLTINALGTRIAPLLNNDGLTAFEASIRKADVVKQAILTEGGGAGLRVAGSSNVHLDGGGNVFSLQALNDQGQTVYNQILPATLAAGVNLGIYRDSGPGDTTEVARTWNPPEGPGFAFSQIYNFVTPQWTNAVSLTDQGELVFPARASDTGEVGTSYAGFWREDSAGQLAPVVRSGDPAPGTSDTFQLASSPPTIATNRVGRIAFIGRTDGPALNLGVWSEQAAGLQLAARVGSPAPGIDGASFSTFNATPGFALNSQGHLLLLAQVAGAEITHVNNLGLWRNRGSGLELSVRSGEPAPGAPTGQIFRGFRAQVINAHGNIAIIAETREFGGAAMVGIWSDGGGRGVEMIAYPGTPAPGTRVVFGSPVALPFISGPAIVLNARGQVAFQGTLAGPGIDATNNDGIWAQDRAGILRLIAREGDPLNVSDDPLQPDWRTVRDLFVAGASGNDDGRRSWFNDHGQLAYWASFTDGSHGIFVSSLATVPEPRSFVPLVLALGIPCRWRIFRDA